METIRIHGILQETLKANIQRGKTIGFVPTMGALHKGHINLLRMARSENEIVVVSIFVNPLQFGQDEDFNRYPRDIEGDIEKLRKENVDILFMPDSRSMYPPGFLTYVNINNLSDKLCGAYRPGHFRGVATVACKLFNIVKPTRAYFGQKDFQQTVIIKRMVEDLNMDVEIVVCPTVRESDGLAMSSRNAYLNSDERMAAGIIFKTLQSALQMIKSGSLNASDVKIYMHTMLKSEPLISEIQYAALYDAEALNELTEFRKQNLLATAVKIGATRLIDNMLVDL